MNQNKTNKKVNKRIVLVRLLIKIDNWANTYSDGRGNIPPTRRWISAICFSFQRKLLKPLETGLTEDQLDELDNLVYQWD
jgi:hypothetical protein